MFKDYFVKVFGKFDSEGYRVGVDVFKRLLVVYSVIFYVFQFKDRYNGNVLIDNEGYIIYIDFGFMLLNLLGLVGFEVVFFKFMYEYVDVLGGVGLVDYEDFKKFCKQVFQGEFFIGIL